MALNEHFIWEFGLMEVFHIKSNSKLIFAIFSLILFLDWSLNDEVVEKFEIPAYFWIEKQLLLVSSNLNPFNSSITFTLIENKLDYSLKLTFENMIKLKKKHLNNGLNKPKELLPWFR